MNITGRKMPRWTQAETTRFINDVMQAQADGRPMADVFRKVAKRRGISEKAVGMKWTSLKRSGLVPNADGQAAVPVARAAAPSRHVKNLTSTEADRTRLSDGTFTFERMYSANNGNVTIVAVKVGKSPWTCSVRRKKGSEISLVGKFQLDRLADQRVIEAADEVLAHKGDTPLHLHKKRGPRRVMATA